MGEKSFSAESIHNLRDNLMKAKVDYCAYHPELEKLIGMIDVFQKEQTYSYPKVLSDLPSMINCLTVISPECAGMIADSTKKCCLECMFHSDDCFVNIIFLIFKSLELNITMQPNKIRPTMRQEAFQHTLTKFNASN